MRAITFYALLITGSTLGAFLWALNVPGASTARAETVAFMVLALAQIFHLGNARSRGPVSGWRSAIANPWALGALALTIALQLFAIYFAPLARVLDVVPLAAGDWLLIIPLALFPAVVGQAIALRRQSRKAREVAHV